MLASKAFGLPWGAGRVNSTGRVRAEFVGLFRRESKSRTLRRSAQSVLGLLKFCNLVLVEQKDCRLEARLVALVMAYGFTAT